MTLDKRTLTILVSALGYFVDIYDIQLFNLISKTSLVGIGIQDVNLLKSLDYELFLWQMGGMLIGGLFWGIMGDKKGRKNILFGSILIYSLANIANAFVTNIEQYQIIRFIAGLGLAGELGAAITLVSESMENSKRGYGTMVVVSMGALGAVAAYYLSNLTFTGIPLDSWQIAYLIGGLLGLLLLLLRVSTFDSALHQKILLDNSIKKGNFLQLFQTKERALRYLACIAIGLPVWFAIGVLIKFAPIFLFPHGVPTDFDFGKVILNAYLGLCIGDIFSSLLSQFLKSRKKVIYVYLLLSAVVGMVFLSRGQFSSTHAYLLSFFIGMGTGYWALFVSLAAELFGTNIRSTVASTVPNFVRGAVVPMVLLFKFLELKFGSFQAATMEGIGVLLIAIIAAWYIQESFGRELEYTEN